MFAQVLLVREKQLLLRNQQFLASHVFSDVFMGLIVGSLFFQLNPQSFQIRYGLLFLGAPTLTHVAGVAKYGAAVTRVLVLCPAFPSQLCCTLCSAASPKCRPCLTWVTAAAAAACCLPVHHSLPVLYLACAQLRTNR